KLHLEEDPIGNKRPTWVSYSYQRPSHAKSFAGSAATAATLYKRAISKGSNAARINLGALHELGHGVERDLEKAAQLYREAAGTRFKGPAQLGLVRLSLDRLWLTETLRRRRLLADIEQARETPLRDDDIIIEAQEYLWMQVTDSQGRRVFVDHLQEGAQY